MAVLKRSSAGSTLLCLSIICLSILLLTEQVHGQYPPPKDDAVHLVNNLGENLVVHCASRDDDLGTNGFGPGQTYTFEFNQNVWGTTVFTCDMSAQGFAETHVQVWKGWGYTVRPCKCFKCTWNVTPTGFYCNGQYVMNWGQPAGSTEIAGAEKGVKELP